MAPRGRAPRAARAGTRARPEPRRPRPRGPGGGSGSSAATYVGRPGRTDQRGPELVGLGDRQLHGDPVHGDPDGVALPALDHGDDLGSPANRASTASGRDAVRTTASWWQESHHRRTSPAGSASRARAMPPTRSQARLSHTPRGERASVSRASADTICASVLGPMPGTSRRRPAAAASRSSPAVRILERAGDVDGALGAQPEVAAEADEVRHQVALELGELRDLSRGHELAQAAPRSRGRCPEARDRDRRRRARRPAPRCGGRSRPPAGRRGSCTDWRRRAPAPPRRRRAGRRSRRCPLGHTECTLVPGHTKADRRAGRMPRRCAMMAAHSIQPVLEVAHERNRSDAIDSCRSPSVAQRAARTIRHPLSRTLLVLTFTTGLVDAVSYWGSVTCSPRT